MINSQPIIEIKNVSIYLGGTWVHKNLNLTVQQGEVLGIVGGSGSGKPHYCAKCLCCNDPRLDPFVFLEMN